MQALWSPVDRYITDLLVQPDPVLAGVIDASHAAGLPAINVSPAQGKLLALLVQTRQARRVLEIGTLGGYSTIWMARALSTGGQLTTLEVNPTHAAVARANLERASLAHVVKVLVGPASNTLRQLAQEDSPPYDLVFLDADKPSYPEYLSLILPLVQRGSVIIADNVVRDGAVADGNSTDPNVQGVRRFNELLAAEPRLSATILQTVGSKGYDGLAFAVVTADR